MQPQPHSENFHGPSNAASTGFPSKYGSSGSPSNQHAVTQVSSVFTSSAAFCVRSTPFNTPGPVAIHGMCRLRGSSGPCVSPAPP